MIASISMKLFWIILTFFISLGLFFVVRRWPHMSKEAKIEALGPTFVILGCIVAAFIYTSVEGILTRSSTIPERYYYTYGRNLYYTDIVHNEAIDEETLKTLSEYLGKKYPGLSFCVTGYSEDTLDKENDGIYFYFEQMIEDFSNGMDKAIASNSSFSLNMKNGKINEYDDYYMSEYEVNFVKEHVNLNAKLDATQAKNIAVETAKKHTNEIFQKNEIIKVLKGECHLEYNKADGLFYIVVLNHGSYVKVDANTGEVIDSYFFNGIYY